MMMFELNIFNLVIICITIFCKLKYIIHCYEKVTKNNMSKNINAVSNNVNTLSNHTKVMNGRVRKTQLKTTTYLC